MTGGHGEGRGGAWPPPRSALVSTRRPREGSGRSKRPGLAQKSGARQSGEQTWEPGWRPEETEGREPKGSPRHTLGEGRVRAAGGVGRRRAASGAKTESLEQGARRNPEAGKPIGNDRKQSEPGLDTNRNCTKTVAGEKPGGERRSLWPEHGSLSIARSPARLSCRGGLPLGVANEPVPRAGPAESGFRGF